MVFCCSSNVNDHGPNSNNSAPLEKRGSINQLKALHEQHSNSSSNLSPRPAVTPEVSVTQASTSPKGRRPSFEFTAGKIDNEQRKREIYKAAFDKYDRDGSGSIDVSELSKLFTDLKWKFTREDIQAAEQILDKDGNGDVSFDEFMTWTKFAWNNLALHGGTDVETHASTGSSLHVNDPATKAVPEMTAPSRSRRSTRRPSNGTFLPPILPENE